jgi:hypothetical protein
VGSARGQWSVRVGITDYAQDALGDVVFVELPATARCGLRVTPLARSSRPSRCPISKHRCRGSWSQINDVSDRIHPRSSTKIRTAKGWICLIET